MKLRLRILSIYIPVFIKKRYLIRLYGLTAEAFDNPIPDFRGQSYDRLLEKYALFTKDVAAHALEKHDLGTIEAKLYESSYRIGHELRKKIGLHSADDVLGALSIIYKVLGINFRSNLNGDVTISRCFFSSYYNSETCRLISNLDRGLVAGISGGWQFDFTDRITAGNDCCRARLIIKRGYN